MRQFFRWLHLGVLGIVGVCFPVEVLAFSGDIKNDPSQVVEKYVSLDKRGARLQVNSQEVLAPFVIWTEEPVWGRVVVISEYRVIEDVTQWEILTSTEALIPVTFHVLGTMYWETATFLPEAQIYLEYFHIKAIHERWRIIAPQLPPHVGRKRLLDFIRLEELHESEEARKTSLQHLREQIAKAS